MIELNCCNKLFKIIILYYIILYEVKKQNI